MSSRGFNKQNEELLKKYLEKVNKCNSCANDSTSNIEMHNRSGFEEIKKLPQKQCASKIF
jgi:hypothetical protein